MHFRYDVRAVAHELRFRRRRQRRQGPPGLSPADDPQVTVVCVSNRPSRCDDVVATFGAQTWPYKDLILVANAPGFGVDAVRDLADVDLLETDSSVSLGACLNMGIEAARGDLIVRIDDDDLYSPRYLADVVTTFRTVDAHVVGKCEYFAYVESMDRIVRMNPGRHDRYVGRVAGGTLSLRRDVVGKVSFPDTNIGEDGVFVRRCERAGLRVWAGDPNGFLQMRRRDTSGHTWRISDDDFVAGSEPVGEGHDRSLWTSGD